MNEHDRSDQGPYARTSPSAPAAPELGVYLFEFLCTLAERRHAVGRSVYDVQVLQVGLSMQDVDMLR